MSSDVVDIMWAIGGQSGEGIDSSGEIMAKAVHSEGLYVFAHRDFPSRIRGGFTSYRVRISNRPLFGLRKGIDVCIALDQESCDVLEADASPDSLILYDEELVRNHPPYPNAIGAPLSGLARENGSVIQRNIVGIGATAAILGIPPDVLTRLIEDRFGKKGREIVSSNVRCLKAGEAWWKNVGHNARAISTRYEMVFSANTGPDRPKHLITGNDAVGLGALVGGCRFLSAYPITPATEVMYWLAENLPKFGGAVVQAEDEIAAINMAIGAGFGGIRAMTSTSGPGLSLMSEGFGLAGITETPVVVVDVQRAGPATGMPTKTEQSNLQQALYGGHGDIPRIVLAPSTHEECYNLTAKAFDLAERFQCPVFVLSDQALGLSLASCTLSPREPEFAPSRELVDRRDEEEKGGNRCFPRYEITASGVSPRAFPGRKGGTHIATSYEHDEEGFATEDPKTRTTMMNKRLRKLASLDLSEHTRVEGAKDAKTLLVGWGSTYGPISEALTKISREPGSYFHRPVGHLHFSVISPFPRRAREILRGADTVIVIEGNASAQFARYIVSEVPGLRPISIPKYDGEPFTPQWVLDELKSQFAYRRESLGRPFGARRRRAHLTADQAADLMQAAHRHERPRSTDER